MSLTAFHDRLTYSRHDSAKIVRNDGCMGTPLACDVARTIRPAGAGGIRAERAAGKNISD